MSFRLGHRTLDKVLEPILRHILSVSVRLFSVKKRSCLIKMLLIQTLLKTVMQLFITSRKRIHRRLKQKSNAEREKTPMKYLAFPIFAALESFTNLRSESGGARLSRAGRTENKNVIVFTVLRFRFSFFWKLTDHRLVMW